MYLKLFMQFLPIYTVRLFLIILWKIIHIKNNVKNKEKDNDKTKAKENTKTKGKENSKTWKYIKKQKFVLKCEDDIKLIESYNSILNIISFIL